MTAKPAYASGPRELPLRAETSLCAFFVPSVPSGPPTVTSSVQPRLDAKDSGSSATGIIRAFNVRAPA
jgi:hypothetical protein